LRPEEFAVALEDNQGLLWLDLLDEPCEDCEPLLLETFGFHPLAVDDMLRETHVPKVDDWGEYLYLTLRAVTYDPELTEILDTVELDTFLGANYVVTYQARPIAAVDRVWAACQRDVRHLEKGTVHLMYRLADELANDYMPVIEAIDETIDHIEDRIFRDPKPDILEQIFTLKRALLRLRRILTPQCEVLHQLTRGDSDLIAAQEQVLFRDVYDHFVRLHGISESLRDLVGNALDTYLSVVNNRMKDIMKTLTVVTALFMPLSFIVGFFGMNFFQAVAPLDVWTGKAAFALTIVGMAITPIIMYLWMRRRAWL
jgi:magnesium transporter